jgi:hypothetical protein
MNEEPKKVVAELRRRAKDRHPLNSGANRGDWLYAAALRAYGSWGAAVQAAGFDYDSIRQRGPMTADDVLAGIQRSARAGERLLARQHGQLAEWAKQHFGSWAAAVRKAGHEPASNVKWTAERFADVIRGEVRGGRPVTSLAVIDRLGEGFYKAGCRLHGSWQGALQAAGVEVVRAAPGRPRTGRS